jgi:predicted DCC family thiol-disulfide oxidoreductase YuxK
LLAERSQTPLDLDTLYVIAHRRGGPEKLLFRAEAVLFILQELGSVWRSAAVLAILPNRLLNILYNVVASSRYRFFGKYDSCPLPDQEHRSRFIDA